MCDRHYKEYYKKYKKWCDDLFLSASQKRDLEALEEFFLITKKDNWEKDFKFVSGFRCRLFKCYLIQ